MLLRLKHFPHCLHSKTFSVLWIALDLLVKMVMNILGVGGRGEIYANALIEKEKDDLTEGDQRESRGDTMKKKKIK